MARAAPHPFWQDLDLAQIRGPRYRVLAAAIERGITSGQLSVGSKMPPQRDLAFDLGVTVGTVGRAYDLLMRQSRLRGEVGRGTFICGTEESAAKRPGTIDDGASGINLTVNMPIRTAAMHRMADILANVAASPEGRASIGSYPPTQGHWQARCAASAWLAAQGVEISTEQVLLSSGAQSGLAAVLSAVAKAGDGILLEQLTYTRFATLARGLGMRLESVSMDDRGLRPEALDAACRQGRGRVLLLTPTLHNPTGITMDEVRRNEIVEVARAHDVFVIEDDVYGVLHLEGLPKLQTLMPERTAYITSLSKFLAPGLRIGIIAVPPRLIHAVTGKQADFSIATPALTGLGLIEAQREGLLENAAEQQRTAIAQRQIRARRHFNETLIASSPQTLHLWLELPDARRVDEVIMPLAERGIKVANGRFFAVDSRSEVPFMRISLGPLDDNHMDRDLSAIAEAISKAPLGELAI